MHAVAAKIKQPLHEVHLICSLDGVAGHKRRQGGHLPTQSLVDEAKCNPQRHYEWDVQCIGYQIPAGCEGVSEDHLKPGPPQILYESPVAH